MADRAVPPAVGFPGRGGRTAPPLAGAPEPLVSTWSATACGRASAIRSTVPRRATLEAAARAAAPSRASRRAGACRRAAPISGSCGGASPAACNAPLQNTLYTGCGRCCCRARARRSSSRRQRAGRDVAGRRQPGTLDVKQKEALGQACSSAAAAARCRPTPSWP